MRWSVMRDMTAPYSALEARIYDLLLAPAVVEAGKPLLARLAEELGDARRLLDVGCGGGQLAIELAKADAALDVTGLDLSAAQVARARSRSRWLADRVRFVEGSVMSLPFESESFDVVVSVASIKHWPDQAKGLAECVRVLRTGGRLMVFEVDRGCRLEDAGDFVQKTRVPRPFAPFALAAFRTWVAGRSLDLPEAQALVSALPLEDARAERVVHSPALVLRGRKRP